MKLAIIGSGISGLSAAYYLSKNHKVDLFEKEDHFGGHSHTIDIKIQLLHNMKLLPDNSILIHGAQAIFRQILKLEIPWEHYGKYGLQNILILRPLPNTQVDKIGT